MSGAPEGARTEEGGQSAIRLSAAALVAAFLVLGALAPASAPADCNTRACTARVAKKQAIRAQGVPWCRATWRCVRRAHRRHPELALPFAGPHGTRWAIPWAVVRCESGTSGLWRAANPSGAVGPYQLLGWGAPYPADTPAKRMQHHRIAARLYAANGLRDWAASRACWG